MKREASDIVIVGGGVIGMAVAYYLSRDTDHSVTVIDIKKPGNATRASAGGLWAIGESVGLGCGVIFFKTLSKRRREGEGDSLTTERPPQLPPYFFDLSLKSNDLFPGLWRELKEIAGVDFKLEQNGLKFVMLDQDDVEYAKEIHRSIPNLADQMAWLDREELRREEPYLTDRALGALKFLRDGQVNPYLLAQAFRGGALAQGARIIENTEVTGVRRKGDRVTSVETPHRTIPCSLLINAAGAWASEIGSMLGLSLPVKPIKGQIVLSERLPPLLYSSFSTSDCYIAQKDNGEVLIGSTTEDRGFDTSTTFKEIQEICIGASKAIPVLKNLRIKRTWAGLRPGTPDELPILGPVKGLDGYLNACGHFRTGILTSAITGNVITELVLGERPSIPLEPFLLDRFESRIQEMMGGMGGMTGPGRSSGGV